MPKTESLSTVNPLALFNKPHPVHFLFCLLHLLPKTMDFMNENGLAPFFLKKHMLLHSGRKHLPWTSGRGRSPAAAATKGPSVRPSVHFSQMFNSSVSTSRQQPGREPHAIRCNRNPMESHTIIPSIRSRSGQDRGSKLCGKVLHSILPKFKIN